MALSFGEKNYEKVMYKKSITVLKIAPHQFII